MSADAEDLKVMMKKITEGGKSIPELMAEGRGQMQTVSAAPAGGAVAASGAGAAEKKEEAKKEESEDDNVSMGGMFGDEDEY